MASSVIGALRVNLGIDTAAFIDGLKKASGGLDKTGKQLQKIGQSLSLKVTAPIALAGGLILRTAGDFEAGMNRIAAATGATNDELAALERLARDLGKSTTFSATEAADAIEMLAKNGVSTADILGGTLKASLDLAAASGSELAGAADLATDVMLNFGKGTADLGAVVDGVSGVLLESKFGFDDYRLALAQAGGVAGGLGVTLEDFNAVIAATSARFASGSDAGTSFKTFLQRLVPSSKAATEAMNALGLEFFDADGNLKSMAGVAQELQTALSGLSDEAKSEALSTIFGTDAMRTAIGLMEAGAQGVRDLDAAIGSASAAEQAAARTKGWTGALEQLGGAFDELKLAIADSGMLETATGFVQALTGIIDKLSEANPSLLRLGVVFGGIAAALGPALVAIGLFTTAIAAIGIPIAAAIAAIAALTAAVVAFWPEIVAAKDAVVQFGTDAVAAINAFGDGAAAKIDEVAQAFLGLVETMKQIGRDIIDGLLAGLRERWESVTEWLSGAVSGLADRARAVLGIQSPSTVFAEIGRNVMQGFAAGLEAEQDGIRSAMDGFASDLASTFKGVLTGAMDLREGLGNILGGLADSFLTKGIGALGAAIGIPGFANGTDFAPGGLALVGERGPELVHLPRGSRVTPNHALGGTVQVHVTASELFHVMVQRESEATVRRAAPAIVGAAVQQAGAQVPLTMARYQRDVAGGDYRG